MLLRRPVLIMAMCIYVAVEGLTWWCYRGPAPKLADVAIGEFSAERAAEIHEELFPPKPHYTGSIENQLVRDRLVEMLRIRGWRIDVQSAVVESNEVKAQLSNVLAEWPQVANRDARPLVLSSHYDSCRGGPGASDAGACVAAIIEASTVLIERHAGTDGQLKRPLFLLFTDGEELGTLGADQFARRHPLSARHPIVLNFDARGTSGPVLMYETSPGNRSQVAAWINHIARPRVTGSPFTAVYRLMPNGSDFTQFRKTGWEGFNFAMIGDAQRYHTPDDTLPNLDRSSLQHYGEIVLRLAGHIVEEDLRPSSTGDALYFDVFGWYVVHCPLSWCMPIGVIGCLAILAVNRHRLLEAGAVRTLALCGLCSVLVMIAVGTEGWFLGRLWRDIGLLPRQFVSHGPVLCLVLWLFALATSLGIARWLLSRCSYESVWAATWVNWSLAGLSVSVIMPEFSHLAFLPELAAIGLSVSSIPQCLRVLGALLAVTLSMMPLQHLLMIALGPGGGLFWCPAIALLAIPLYPALGSTFTRSVSEARRSEK